jgi:hypothetical protein
MVTPVDRALQLLAAGYQPVACHGKAPIYGGWQKGGVTAETIRAWASDPRVTNIGVLTGTLIGLDIDVLDAGMSERVKNLALRVLGDTSLIRVGKSPKQMMGYRIATPIKKKIFVGVANGQTHKVEVLGAGQQFVAYGPYPGSLRFYVWPEADLASTPFETVPETSSEALEAFGQALVEIIGPPPVAPPAASAAPVARPVNGHDQSDSEEALNALHSIPADIEYGEWVRVAMALQAAFGDAGLRHWDEWSAKGTKYKAGECARKWSSIRQNHSIHRETLFQIARDRGGWRASNDKGRDLSSMGLFNGRASAPRHDPETGEILEDDEKSEPTPLLAFTPYTRIDPRCIPPRRFLYGRHYIRQFLSTDISPGGVGKSSLVIAEALAMASHKSLLGSLPTERIKVAYWNGEDPIEELQRRIESTALHYGIEPQETAGRMFVDSGRLLPLILAYEDRKGPVVDQDVVNAIVTSIKTSGIDVLIIDPFISSHRVSENDNNAIDLVAKAWSHIADVTGCAVNLVHHSRKLNGEEVTVDSGRGASALVAACRSARTLNQMTKDEASRLGVENHRFYFRVDDGKSSMQPPLEDATWHRLVNVDLPNGPMGTVGDKVGVVTRWEKPDPMGVLTARDLRAVQNAVAGGKWRDNAQARDWVGKAIAKALGLALPEEASRVKFLLQTWIKSGALTVVRGLDSKRMPRDFIEVGDWVETD